MKSGQKSEEENIKDFLAAVGYSNTHLMWQGLDFPCPLEYEKDTFPPWDFPLGNLSTPTI